MLMRSSESHYEETADVVDNVSVSGLWQYCPDRRKTLSAGFSAGQQLSS